MGFDHVVAVRRRHISLTRRPRTPSPTGLYEAFKRNIGNGLSLMSSPQLEDDGRVVTLDLHGATVDEAIDLTYRTLRLAEDRGRSRLKLIHGSSTTGGGRRTIKSALHGELDRGRLGRHATNVVRSKDELMLSLDLAATSDPTPIRLQDVRR